MWKRCIVQWCCASKFEFWCLLDFRKVMLHDTLLSCWAVTVSPTSSSVLQSCAENNTPSCSVLLSIRCIGCFWTDVIFTSVRTWHFHKLKNICIYDNKLFLNVNCIPDCYLISFIFSLLKFQCLAHSFRNTYEDSLHGNISWWNHSTTHFPHKKTDIVGKLMFHLRITLLPWGENLIDMAWHLSEINDTYTILNLENAYYGNIIVLYLSYNRIIKGYLIANLNYTFILHHPVTFHLFVYWFFFFGVQYRIYFGVVLAPSWALSALVSGVLWSQMNVTMPYLDIWLKFALASETFLYDNILYARFLSYVASNSEN